MTPGLFIECIKLWWQMFFYSEWFYFALFLPLTALIYQAAGRKKRKFVLLSAGWFLMITLSGWLFLCNLAAVIICRELGVRMGRIDEDGALKRKEKAAKKRRLLLLGVLLLLSVLLGFKYLDFFGENICLLLSALRLHAEWKMLDLAVPMGISYYTLEAIGYLTDVSGGRQKPEKSYADLALFLSFFPKIIEGPIERYGHIHEELAGGSPIRYESLTEGYQRILWGLFKKLMVADHLAPAVSALYGDVPRDGSTALAAAVFFTVQEYADFSGTIDIAIGSARIFGVHLAENFRQPFFAKNASDFWRRWHITLGAFFRDYVFYPAAISKKVMKLSKKLDNKMIPTAVALFAVWSLNGLWHGPKWNYLFFGLYYFVVILLENILEEPMGKLVERLRIREDSFGLRLFRFVKLAMIVMTGEMFFRAESVRTGFQMLGSIFTSFHWSVFAESMGNLGMDVFDYWTVALSLCVMLAFGLMKEKEIRIRERFMELPAPVRYAFWYLAVLSIVIFGAYGSGYSITDAIYAKF